MVYSTITSKRIPYDIDGTTVGYYYSTQAPGSDSLFINGPQHMLTAEQKTILNQNDTGYTITSGYYRKTWCVWFFFPEKREIEMIAALVSGELPYVFSSIQGSNDTTNGADGTWETATFPNGVPVISNNYNSWWRLSQKAVSLSTSYQSIRMRLSTEGSSSCVPELRKIHLYGTKAAGETPDDLVFCETDGTEITAVNDFQDRPEASTAYDSFKIKNVSPDKTATTVNVNVTHTDFLLSLSETGPWTANVDIASIAPAALTDTIYIKNELGQPPLTLGPKAARVVTTIGSWV